MPWLLSINHSMVKVPRPFHRCLSPKRFIRRRLQIRQLSGRRLMTRCICCKNASARCSFPASRKTRASLSMPCQIRVSFVQHCKSCLEREMTNSFPCIALEWSENLKRLTNMPVSLDASAEHRLAKAAQRVLSDLDRMDQRLSAVYAAERAHERAAFQGRVPLRFADETPDGTATDLCQIHVWTRDVSRSGMSFIYPEQVTAKKCQICLGDPNATNAVWRHAEIVRGREVQDGFWEYGVRFVSRNTI